MFLLFSIPLKFVNSTLHYFDLLAEPENKLALLATAQYVIQFERISLRDGKMSVKFLDEVLRPEFVTISMPWFSPLFEEFKDKIQRLVEAGVCPDRLAGKVISDKFGSSQNTDIPPLVLNMEDLGIGFVVCLVPLALSAVVFISEIALPRIMATKTRDLLTFLYLIRAVAKVRFGF